MVAPRWWHLRVALPSAKNARALRHAFHLDADMDSPSEMVFVYGTLRRGGSNHFRMAGAEFVAAGTVRGRLYRIDWYPGLIADENVGDVVGEIYQLSAGMLPGLDDYEGPEYRRAMMEVRTDRTTIQAWVWLWTGAVDENRRIACGDWMAGT
jgi:gamma-glutamylcyclotransferase (GGCT)/AIG2-like uncharacterized protein YtfP